MQTKEWAKAQNINDPKSGTLNSFSLCLLVIFHFQVLFPLVQPSSFFLPHNFASIVLLFTSGISEISFLTCVAASIFQTCEPAILPPLKEICGGNIVDDIAGTHYIMFHHVILYLLKFFIVVSWLQAYSELSLWSGTVVHVHQY